MPVNKANTPQETTWLASAAKEVLYARTTGTGKTVGVVSDSEASPLALLATGVAGMAARRALREQMKQTLKPASVTSETAGKRELN